MSATVNYQAKAAEACIRFANVLDEIQGMKAKIEDALSGCDKPFTEVVGDFGDQAVSVSQSHLGRYFQNGGRLPIDRFLGEEPDAEYGSDIHECEACMLAFKLCIQRKKMRQKRGHAQRLIRYYGRKAGEVAHG